MYLDESGDVLMSWIVSSNIRCGVGDLVIWSLLDRVRDESSRGLDVATGRMDEALSDVGGEAMALDPLSRSVSLSLRIGRGLAAESVAAIDGTGILGAERTGLTTTGSVPLENLRTSEGLSRRLLTCWPWPLLLLDSFQLRRWIEGLVGVLPLLAPFPAPPPLPFSSS